MMRASIMKLIRKGNVYVNGKRVNVVSYELHVGDLVEMHLPKDEATEHLLRSNKPHRIQAIKMPLSVVYEDENILVLDKPSGISVQPGTRVYPSLLSGLNYLGERKGFRPYLVHRLDKYTSGILVVAKNTDTARHLALQFKAHSIEKEYHAVVVGKLRPKRGEISNSLDGKEAFTSYDVVKESDEFSLLRIRIKTGRKHQIRRHLASISHPVLGDDLYGDGKINRELRRRFGFKGYLLRCTALTVDVPHKGRLTFKANPNFEYLF